MCVCSVIRKLLKLKVFLHAVAHLHSGLCKGYKSCLGELLSTELIKQFFWNKVKNDNKSVQVFENVSENASQKFYNSKYVAVVRQYFVGFFVGFVFGFGFFFPLALQWFYVVISQVRWNPLEKLRDCSTPEGQINGQEGKMPENSGYSRKRICNQK